MPRQTSIQLTEATERQVETLKTRGFGTFTDIVRIAVDRMYIEERRSQMNNRIERQAERNNHRWIVHGPHWSWGSGYATYDQARKALRSSQFGFGATRCQCGRWVSGLIDGSAVCANCTK